MSKHTNLFRAWQQSGLGEREYWRRHYANELTYAAFHGRLWRARHGIVDTSHLFRHDLGTPLALDAGQYIVIGDVQIPTTSYDFAALPLAIASRYLPRGQRNLVIAGDLINADAFSGYESDIATLPFARELDAARVFFSEYCRVFDRIYVIMGNHERRVGKRTGAALKARHLFAMMTHDKRVVVSEYGWLTVANRHGHPWRVTHGRAYSVNQLTVPSELALKFQMNILAHHEHHLAVGYDRFKRYLVVNNGGMFDPAQMAYVTMDDSKMPNMARGFTWLDDGYPVVFGEDGFTNWDRWLGSGKRVAA